MDHQNEQTLTIRTTTNRTNEVYKSFKLDVISRFTGSKSLERIVRRVLEDVERIRNIKPTPQPMWAHHFSNVRCTCSVVFGTFLLVHPWVAAHERHVVHLGSVIHDTKDSPVSIAPQALSHGWLYSVKMVPRICHGDFLGQIGVLYPREEVDDLLAIQIYHSKLFAFLDFEREAMAAFDDIGRCGGWVASTSTAIRPLELWKYHD